jgi:hypothetical protein
MKKIYYIAFVAVIGLLASCESYNERNFPDLDESIKPTNLVSYKYTLADADYNTISSAALKIAKNATDSAAAKAISTNKFFVESAPASNYIPLLLATKYLYTDEKSTVLVTYNLNKDYDTTTIATADKYTLLKDDYDAMGTGTGAPGQYDNFSASIDPGFYISIWLKLKYPYAKAKDKKLIRYAFYANNTTILQKTVFVFDGTNWAKYATKNQEVAKFVNKSKTWQYIDSDILIGLNDGLGDFKTVNVLGDQVWAWDSYKYMKMTGYVSGAYFDNEDWLISPAMDFTERVTPWLTFNHVGRYFGDTGTSKDKMYKAITVWISTKSDGTSIHLADWEQLTIPEAGYPSGANWTFITSTPISLAKYAGKSNVRIAFRYLSTASDNAAGTWELKNFFVYEE